MAMRIERAWAVQRRRLPQRVARTKMVRSWVFCGAASSDRSVSVGGAVTALSACAEAGRGGRNGVAAAPLAQRIRVPLRLSRHCGIA